MTISSGFTVWSVQLASTPPALKTQSHRFSVSTPHFLGTPSAGPIHSSNGVLIVPCKNALVAIAAATGASLWSTSIVPANQIGGIAMMGAEGGGVRVAMTGIKYKTTNL